ncbi:hypothetical protein, partial [Streptomyces lunaelactis]|uniref:hypothetical protein n=1 Tax=Streptomyces lunaelactis TaxID=1535768 RepID=UPI0035A000C3
MAVRAVQHVLAPPLGDAPDPGDLVHESGGDDQPARAYGAAARERHGELARPVTRPVPFRPRHPVVPQ